MSYDDVGGRFVTQRKRAQCVTTVFDCQSWRAEFHRSADAIESSDRADRLRILQVRRIPRKGRRSTAGSLSV